MKAKRNILKVILILAFILSAFAFIRWYLNDPLNVRAPSDEKLFAVFHRHFEAFESLRHMMMEDVHLGPIVNVADLKGAKLDDSLKRKYIKLISEIDPHLELTIDNNNVARFIFAGGGISAISPGWLKGIEYISGDIGKHGVVLTNLNKARTLAPGIYLRPIEARWFLVYQRTDD